jgi:hypothetical protein
VSAQAPRRRKSAAPPSGKTVKASVLVGVELHARWSAAAALRGIDRSAFAAEAIAEACRGIIVVDRRKAADRVKTDDRPSQGGVISPDVEEEAA